MGNELYHGGASAQFHQQVEHYLQSSDLYAVNHQMARAVL